MNISIQDALKNCIQKEVDKFNRITEEYDIENFMISTMFFGTVLGTAGGYAMNEAGGLANLPEYLYAQGEVAVDYAQTAASMATDFWNKNSNAIMGVGGSIAGVGAIVFLKGVAEAGSEISKRVAHAFNWNGHGQKYLDAITRSYDKILANHKGYGSALEEESKWVRDFSLRTVVEVGSENMAKAYLHGVKRCFAMALMEKQDVSVKLDFPTKEMRAHILDGMTEYFRAVDKQSPGLINRMKYVLSGDVFMIKDRDHDAQAVTAINPIISKKLDDVLKHGQKKRDSSSPQPSF